MKKLLILMMLFPAFASAQSKKEERRNSRAPEVGEVQFGIRSTLNFFDDFGSPGLGYGGMFRIRPAKRINTEWYADYIKSDIGGLGYRETMHIGWSVMFYPFKTETLKGKLTPYFVSGNCFDYAKVSANSIYSTDGQRPITPAAKRYTTAVQAGIGANYHFTNFFNLSLSAQYMEHLGKDLHTEIVNASGIEVTDSAHYSDAGNTLHIESEKHELKYAGHMLITMSLNVRLFDFAKNGHS